MQRSRNKPAYIQKQAEIFKNPFSNNRGSDMKAYEKWRAKERKHFLSIGADCSRSDSEAAWREALEMVMMHEMHRYGNDFMTDKPMNVLYNFLRRELEEE